MDAVEKAHALYKTLPNGDRNDGVVMQHLIPNWTFDPNRPALVR